MCIEINRQYTCWDNTPQPGVNPRAAPGHKVQMLVRCANPTYRACIHPQALSWIQEYYTTACPTCSGKGICHDAFLTARDPLQPDDEAIEARPEAKDAATAYVLSLATYFNTVLNNSEAADDQDLLDKYITCVAETNCRMKPLDHVGRGPNCSCDYANVFPELYNVSAAMRRIPAQIILSKNEEFDLDQTTWHGHLPQLRQEYTEHALEKLKEGLPERLPIPTACLGKGTRDLPVMDVCITDSVEEQQSAAMFDQMVQETLASLGGSETWAMSYMTAHVMDTLSYESRTQATSMLYQRIRILHIVARLLRTDSGLTTGRRRTVFGMFLELLHPHPSMLTPETPYRDHFASLMQAAKWSVARDEEFPPRTLGALFANNGEATNLENHLRRNRDANAHVQIDRVSAAINAVAEELTEAELWALPHRGTCRGADRECPLCRQHMTHGPGQPPSQQRPVGDGKGHRAVRLRCSHGHVVGLNCWIRHWRIKREALSVITCMVCNERLVELGTGSWVPEPYVPFRA